MKNFNQKIKRSRNKKGFTLVEIIVVLVILAVLAAAAVPTMLGFVEDSKGKAEIANARAAYIACQSIATEEFASGMVQVAATGKTTATLIGGTIYTIANDQTTKLNKMLGADMTGAKITPTIADGKVTTVVYLDPKGKYEVTITPNEAATVVKK